jgi:hypothetical protein
MQPLPIPSSLQPYFQEYDLADLRLRRDATLEAFHQVAQLPFMTSFYLVGGTGLSLHCSYGAILKCLMGDTDRSSPREFF